MLSSVLVVVTILGTEIDAGPGDFFGSANTLIGICSSSFMRTFSGMAITISVSVTPGATQFTVIPLETNSLASDLLNAARRPLEAA